MKATTSFQMKTQQILVSRGLSGNSGFQTVNEFSLKILTIYFTVCFDSCMQKAFQNVELTRRPLLEFSEIHFAMIATLTQYVIYAVTQCQHTSTASSSF